MASEPTQSIPVVWYHALDRYNQDTGLDLHNALPGQQDLNTKAMILSFLSLRPSQKPLVPALEPILDDIDWLLNMANNGEVKRVNIRIIHIVVGGLMRLSEEHVYPMFVPFGGRVCSGASCFKPAKTIAWMVLQINTTTLEHASIIDLLEHVPRAEGSLREKTSAFASREIFFDILASIVIMMGLGRKSLVASRRRRCLKHCVQSQMLRALGKPSSWPVIAQDASVRILISKLRWQLGEVSWELGLFIPLWIVYHLTSAKGG